MQLGQHGLKICPEAQRNYHKISDFLNYFFTGAFRPSSTAAVSPVRSTRSQAGNKYRLEPTSAGLVGLIAKTVNAHNYGHDEILSIHFAGAPDSFSMAMPGGLRLQPRELKTERAACTHIARLVRPGDEDSSEGVSLRKAGTGCHCKWSPWHQTLARSTYDGKPLWTTVHVAGLSDSHTLDVFSHGGSTTGRILGNAINTLPLVGLLQRRSWDRPTTPDATHDMFIFLLSPSPSSSRGADGASVPIRGRNCGLEHSLS